MRTIQLTPSQNKIARNYLRGEEVFCVCDTTLASFTVTMPDCEGIEDVIFNFINVGANILTISCLTRQNISGKQSFQLRQFDTARIIIDSAVSRYLISVSKFSIIENVLITPEGGVAHKYRNGTGSVSVKGTVVHIIGDNTVDGIIVDVPDPIGVIYESGISNNSEMWVVTEGKAECLVIGTCTAGQLARGFVTADAGYIKGSLICEAVPTSPFATDKHFYEFGHVNTGRTGAGLAMIQIHKN